MVEHNKTKRERNIRAKLMAAIAMLLVSSIMMVSTTYAWFTLSTAPEVTGITTNIASNGNLEIALSPTTGVGTDVGDATTSTTGWLAKNLTWGNLVDMGYEGNTYGLDKLTLAPSALYLTQGEGGIMTLGANVLATPSYGADGRISELKPNAFMATKDGTDFIQPTVNATTNEKEITYGVRAVGTSSQMSAQASKQREAVAAIESNRASAVNSAAKSLSDNGAALAAMLVMHAEAGSGTDTKNNYAEYIPALVSLTEELENSLDYIDAALRASLAAAATTIEDETAFKTAIDAIEGKDGENYKNDLETLVSKAGELGFTVPEQFTTVLNARKTIATKITTAKGQADTLMASVDDGNGGVAEGADKKWADVSGALGNLMNTDGDIKVSGYSIDEIKAKMEDMNFLMGLAKDCRIELGAGSGLYYEMAQITGNITSVIKKVPISARGIEVELTDVVIKTTVTANTSYLPLLKDACSQIKAVTSSGKTIVDSTYGYIIDLMVRTNAADSKLLLQTDPAQRVYADSSSQATMGKGASFVFQTQDAAELAAINKLLGSLRVVFFDPTNGTNKVLGLAKVVDVSTTETKIGTEEVTVQETLADGSTTTKTETVDIIRYTVTGYLELCEMEGAASGGVYSAGDPLADEETTSYHDGAVLCDLTQNSPKAISVMVYLDGEDVTSADVLADRNVTAALNLQFASSVTLKPMVNSDLRDMTVPTESTEAP